jgi:hypothetical protein
MGIVSKIRYKFIDTWLYRWVLSAFRSPKTFFFLKKYPFWRGYNVWTRRFLGWGNSMYDWIPKGWKKAFGSDLTKDIAAALRADGIPKRKWTKALQWTDIKEKYGTLRLYADTTDKVQRVLDKYECLSCGYCELCGKPARYVTDGWISYLCEDCFNEEHQGYKRSGSRLTKEDIPLYYHYDAKTKEETRSTPLENWGIDIEEIWGLKE